MKNATSRAFSALAALALASAAGCRGSGESATPWPESPEARLIAATYDSGFELAHDTYWPCA